MGFILSIFSFKKKAIETFNLTKLQAALDFIQEQIKKYEEFKELDGKQKKARVDEAVASYLEQRFHSDNDIVQYIINTIVDTVPFITQKVFDLLKIKF